MPYCICTRPTYGEHFWFLDVESKQYAITHIINLYTFNKNNNKNKPFYRGPLRNASRTILRTSIIKSNEHKTMLQTENKKNNETTNKKNNRNINKTKQMELYKNSRYE